jgi:adenylate cyclase
LLLTTARADRANAADTALSPAWTGSGPDRYGGRASITDSFAPNEGWQIMTNPQDYPQRRPERSRRTPDMKPLWPTYLGITGLLLLILVALAGGIIWYNSSKSNELALAATKRLMKEEEHKIIERIKLLYDPIYAIVAIASMVPVLTSPEIAHDPPAQKLMLRALRFYPQIQSLYVGFDNGDFHMVTHIVGDRSAALRNTLQAPSDAAFAVEDITGAGGGRQAQWSFLSEDGAVIGRRDPAPTTFDPRRRPWYDAAKRSDFVEESELYIFASSGEPGFTLSRSFNGPTPGVIGADLAAIDLADFLRGQKITESSTAFIFTGKGAVVAAPNLSLPNLSLLTAKPSHIERTLAMLPKLAELNDPVIAGLIAAYRDGQMAGTRQYNVAGRPFIGRIVAIPPRYGRDQLLAIMVPIDEIEAPIAGIRNETLLYSIAFLVFVLPLYVTLVVAWIDRRLGRRPWPQFRDDE